MKALLSCRVARCVLHIVVGRRVVGAELVRKPVSS